MEFLFMKMTAPDKVIEEILEQLPEDTQKSSNNIPDSLHDGTSNAE